ncbi:MAG: polysaccharide deacetylase family protein [Flavobacteriales bacterium]
MKRWHLSLLIRAITSLVILAFALIGDLSAWFVILWLVLLFAFTVYASLTLPARLYMDAVCKGEPGTLALTFDDGPHPVHTPALLDLLAKEKVSASFFCIGRNVDAHPAIASRIVEEGHAIGIHSYDHHWTWGFLSSARAAHQITRCEGSIHAATGKRTQLFRPPFGVTSPNLARAVRRTLVSTIGWDLRTFDTTRTPDQVMRRMEARKVPGTIAVLHDTQPGTIELVQRVIAHCRRNGTTLVRCDTHLRNA